MGHVSQSSDTLGNILAAVSWNELQAYDNGADAMISPVNGSYSISPGEGYWAKMSAGGVVSYP